MFYGMDGHGWSMGWGWIVGLVVLVAIVWIIVKTVGQTKTGQGSQKSALDMLKERYAKGEIDKQEFDERKKDLQ